MATEFLCRLVVVSATQLPKTETFSKIDPYIVIKVNGQHFRTTAKDDCEEPRWDEVFFPAIPSGGASSFLTGNIQFILYDENVMSGRFTAPQLSACPGMTVHYDYMCVILFRLPLVRVDDASAPCKLYTAFSGHRGHLQTYRV